MKSFLALVLGLPFTVGLCGATAYAQQAQRPLSMFIKSDQPQACYDRAKMPSTAVTDLHLHPLPFGGRSVPYPELIDYFDKTETRFVLYFGIGQTLPYNGSCTYYLDCKGTRAAPSMKNDLQNAANGREFPQEKINIGLSMTFPDLAHPEKVVSQIQMLDEEYPGLFTWMGEVNVMKQALLGNLHEPATPESIARWKDFMAILRERGIPITLHSDLGKDGQPTLFLPLMQEILRLYPTNKIVWAHMGLSRELTTIDPAEHIKVVSTLLDANPNLMLDVSWTVIPEAYFNTPERRAQYVALFNKYPRRILSGTDFVASANKNLIIYNNRDEHAMGGSQRRGVPSHSSRAEIFRHRSGIEREVSSAPNLLEEVIVVGRAHSNRPPADRAWQG